MARRPNKVHPLNQTARAAYHVAGNPVVTRPEDAVANYFPGLELDGRNLDRRFFPGLVFDFITSSGPNEPSPPRHFGARLSYVDALRDPDLQTGEEAARNLLAQLIENQRALADGEWYLDWIEQDGKKIMLRDAAADGLVVWRLVRSLEPKKLKIRLRRRDRPRRRDGIRRLDLTGWRRRYTDPDTGVISGAYQPGELMQGLCSPWQHDFRDCACFYWASNHPDIVYGEIFPGEPTLPAGIAIDPTLANVRVDWLRADRSRALTAGASNTIAKNRPYQVDHLEINLAWQALNVVLENTEIGTRYTPAEDRKAEPYHSPAELAKHLRESLAPLEMTLALEYLYAMFSLVSDQEAREATQRTGLWSTLAEDVAVARQQLMLIAVNEMQHLHWANQLLWELHRGGKMGAYTPVLRQASTVPKGDGGNRPHQLRPLTPDVLKEFIDVERPRGLIDGAYGHVIATLRQPHAGHPPHLAELAERIASDGNRHESQFLRIKSALEAYTRARPPYPYLRKIRLGTIAETRAACATFARIVRHLEKAYTDNARGDLKRSAGSIARARDAMTALLAIGESCAARGIGIRFQLPRK